MLSKVVMKMLGKIEGKCASCGSTNIDFIDLDDYCTLACKDCGSTELVDIRFSHAKKLFSVAYVKDVKIRR